MTETFDFERTWLDKFASCLEEEAGEKVRARSWPEAKHYPTTSPRRSDSLVQRGYGTAGGCWWRRDAGGS